MSTPSSCSWAANSSWENPRSFRRLSEAFGNEIGLGVVIGLVHVFTPTRYIFLTISCLVIYNYFVLL